MGDHRAVLLDNNPPAIIGYDEAVQIEIEAILHSGTVDLGDEPSAETLTHSLWTDALAVMRNLNQ